MSCTYGCAGYNSCDRCTSCKSNPDCDVSDKSCTYGCASYNSCSKCTSCKSNPDCSATAVSCDYGCASTNSCGICTSCSGNPDCDVTDKSCDYGCAATNSCGKCTSCKSCTPSANETGCTYGTESCSDGCGGTRLCCKGHTHSYSCPSGYSATNSWEVLPEQLPKFVPVVQLPAPVTGHVCLSLVRYVLKLYQKTAVIPKFLMTVAAEPSLVLFLVHAVWLYRHVQKKRISRLRNHR